MRAIVLVAVLICLAYVKAQPNKDSPNDNLNDSGPQNCCLAQYGLSCTANTKQKKSCGPYSECCPDSAAGTGTFQCCPFGYSCNFTAGNCVDKLDFPFSPLPVNLTFGVFSDSLSYTLAKFLGYFQAEGINVTSKRVTGSVQQFTTLQNGGYDFISTALDNVINYVRNYGPPFNSFNQTLDILGFYGDNRNLNQSIFLNPNGPYPTLASFKGGPSNAAYNRTKPIVGVDSPTSGFAYLVYNVFASLGLYNGTDYVINAVGGGNQRQAALAAKKIDAAILGAENGIQSQEIDGNYPAANVYAVVGNVEGSVLAANRTWLDPFGIPGVPNPVVVRLLRAFNRGLQFTLNPANKDFIINFLAASNASVDPAKFYQLNIDPNTGLTPGGVIRQDGTYKLLQIRKQNNGFQNYTSDATLCQLSQPRGGKLTFGKSVNQVYELDTLAYSVLSTGQRYTPPDLDRTCASLGVVTGNDLGDSSNSLSALSALAVLLVSLVLVYLA